MITYCIYNVEVTDCLKLVEQLRIDNFVQGVDWDFSYYRSEEKFVEHNYVNTPPRLHITLYNEKLALTFLLKHSDLGPVQI
jgi:hypothetical protein